MTDPSTDIAGAYDRALKHLIRMAQTPGWKSYAWSRAKELDADKSGIWTGIAQELKEVMTSKAG